DGTGRHVADETKLPRVAILLIGFTFCSSFGHAKERISTAKLVSSGGFMIRNCSRVAIVFCCLAFAAAPTKIAEAKSYFAYISDSPATASAYWVTKDAGFFKKHGLDV